MSRRVVEVVAPSRLHLGMFSFGHTQRRRYGGVGLMVDRPGIVLRVLPAPSFSAVGPLAERAADFAARWARSRVRADQPACRLEIVSAPPEHAGLGVGTQLGMAVAAALDSLFQLEPLPLDATARLMGRGRRSAIGVYGFQLGGLIVESGKLSGESLSPLVSRHAIPVDWRFVLARPAAPHGLAGREESLAFERLPPIPPTTTEVLWNEVETHMLPALADADACAFGDSVYRFGRAAGACFADVQGGDFNGPQIAAAVKTARRLGCRGVGQSSWGPTVFCLAADQQAAESLAAQLAAELSLPAEALLVAGPANEGAVVRINA